MCYETETKMSMVQYAFCVMNNNIDYSLVSYIRTIRCYKKNIVSNLKRFPGKVAVPNMELVISCDLIGCLYRGGRD